MPELLKHLVMATTATRPTAVRKREARRATASKTATKKKPVKKDLSASYNQFKVHEGKQYTGMQIGRSHKWYYDKGEWKETKITPDLWRIFFSVTKRRAGKAPKGSGVPVGTAYHWYILSHQIVTKLNANDYSTVLMGLKYKLAHKRADKDKWSATAATQRKHLVKFLKELIAELEKEPVPIQIEYDGKTYKGEGVPVPETCEDGVCYQLDINLNNESMGIIRSGKTGWKMDNVEDQKLVDAIGQEIMLWYE
jgi:hypothetical protein